MTIWYALAALLAVAWILRWYVVEHYRRKERLLTESAYDGPPAPAPPVSILVAGKDEEDNIEVCVRSLLAQDYPDFEVIAVNDRSGDATPSILDRLAKEFSDRLKVIHVRHLPDGWFGKHHAMHVGVQAARGDWLLFTDADCRQVSRRTLSLSMRESIERKVDFLSLLPVLDNRRFWERWFQPVCAAILLLWFQPRKVNKPQSIYAYANGAFMLMNRRCYDAIGGHPAFRQQANEDIHMARVAKSLGLRLKVMQNDGLYVTHMYRTFKEAWRGWGRIFYGCLGQRRKIALAMTFLLFFSITPWASLVAALAGTALSEGATRAAWREAALVWTGVVLIMQFALVSWYRIVRTPVIWSLGYVLGSLVAWTSLLHAFFQVGGRARTVWRGTIYRAGVRTDEAPDSAPSEGVRGSAPVIAEAAGYGAPPAAPGTVPVSSIALPSQAAESVRLEG